MAKVKKRGGVWWLYGYDADGERVRESLKTGNRDIAETALKDFEAKVAAEKLGIRQSNVSYTQFRKEYLDYVLKERKHRTWVRNRAAFVAFEKYGEPQSIREMTPMLLIDRKERMRRDGMGAEGINRNVRGIKAAMRWAEDTYNIPLQNWRMVNRSRGGPEQRVERKTQEELVFSMEQVNTLVTMARGYWKTVILLGARVGLRPGEIYHARAENVDLEKNLIAIKPCECDCEYCSKDGGVWNPKTDGSERVLPLESDVLAHLKTLPPLLKSPWLVSNKDGKRPTNKSFGRLGCRFIQEVCDKGTLYTLRHTYATQLMDNEPNQKKVAELMGHTNTKMTDRYTHLSTEKMHDVAEKLPRIDWDWAQSSAVGRVA